MTFGKIQDFILKYKFIFVFIIILSVGLYLRFYNFSNIIGYGWDQARDAWKTRDIIHGQLVLNGPRTGVGHFHLGPLWFYLLAPFYYMTNLDPIGAVYFNILVNIFNFIAIFWVTRRIYNEKAALFVSLIFAINRHLIGLTQTPWNVSPVPGVTIFIFYGIYSVVLKNNYKWIPWLAFLTGLFLHLHFSIVFLIPIVFISLFFAKDKKQIIIKGLQSLPLFLIWFIPNIAYDMLNKNGNFTLFSNFFKDYWIKGFHLRFFLYRLNDAFIQFEKVLSLPHQYPFLKYIIPTIFFIVLLFEKNKKARLLGILMLLWFIVPAIGYSFYGGLTSDYYVLINMPMVLYIVYYLQGKLISIGFKPLIFSVLVIVWIFYGYYNTLDLWIKPTYGGLNKVKDEVRQIIKSGGKISFNEGDIKAYLYYTCKEDHKQCD